MAAQASKGVRAVLTVMILATAATAAWAQKAPTPENPVGWRGDGTGCYPDANPPLHWSRVSKGVLALRTQAKKPAGDAPGGQPLVDGVIRQWLVLGPVPAPEGAAGMNKETIPGEAQLSPDDGQKAGAQTWKLLKTDGALIDFNAVLGKQTEAVAYAHAYVYSDADRTVVMQTNSHRRVRFWLNGKPLGKADSAFGMRLELPMVKGWNRLMFKVGPGVTKDPPNDSWYIDPVFYGCAPGDYETKNIRWVTRMPGTSCAAPIIVGSRVFTMAEPDLLVCLNKDDGKILWVRTNNFYEATSDAERKANPAFAEIEPLAARLREITNSFASAAPDEKLTAERDRLQKDIVARLRKIDPAKYNTGLSDVGGAGLVPTSDGQCVYVWLTSCVSACYDLEGNRKWIRLDKYENFEHGFTTSPLLIDGKLICYMRDIVAIDAKTGRTAWVTKSTPLEGVYPNPRFHGSFFGTSIGGVKVFVTPEADIFRASDGKVLFHDPRFHVNQQIPSPVVQNGVLYRQDLDGLNWPPKNKGGFLQIITLPDAITEPLRIAGLKKVQGDCSGYPRYYNNWFMASPLIHDGLAYNVNCVGMLTVTDVVETKVLYQKWLNLNQFEHIQDDFARGVGASPTLAGKYIYITGNFGTTLVIKPGRTYEQVACSRTEFWVPVKDAPWLNHVERTVSCPVFDGRRMYYRGEVNLYCMEEKP